MLVLGIVCFKNQRGIFRPVYCVNIKCYKCYHRVLCLNFVHITHFHNSPIKSSFILPAKVIYLFCLNFDSI